MLNETALRMQHIIGRNAQRKYQLIMGQVRLVYEMQKNYNLKLFGKMFHMSMSMCRSSPTVLAFHRSFWLRTKEIKSKFICRLTCGPSHVVGPNWIFLDL